MDTQMDPLTLLLLAVWGAIVFALIFGDAIMARRRRWEDHDPCTMDDPRCVDRFRKQLQAAEQFHGTGRSIMNNKRAYRPELNVLPQRAGKARATSNVVVSIIGDRKK